MSLNDTALRMGSLGPPDELAVWAGWWPANLEDVLMNASQFERWLRREHGILSEAKRGTGHKILFNPANGRKTDLPMHGGRKQLGTGLVRKIMKELGLQ